MAITQVRAQVNGVWYALTYDAAQRCYVAEIPAGETSADQPGGWYNVTVEVSNDAGKTAMLDGHDIPGLQLVVKDLTAPTVALVSPPQGYVTTQTPEIVVDLTDDSSGIDISTLAVTINGEPESSVSTAAIASGYRATITPTLADGLHTVEISVNDQDGNTGTLELLYTVDTTPPVLEVYDHRLVVDEAEVLIRGYAQDAAGASVTASAGGWTGETAPDADGAWRLSVPLAVGVNEITVTATDGAGLTSTWTGTVVRLITDRVKADLDAVRAILARLNAGTGSAADLAAINSPTQRGAYNDTDLNRVSAAAELVYQSLVGQGISVDYARVMTPHGGASSGGNGYSYNSLRITINQTRGTPGLVQLSEIELINDAGEVYPWPAGTTVSTNLPGFSGEGPDKLIDGSVDTKYCAGSFAPGTYVEIHLPDYVDLSVYSRWRWYTANDDDVRDPVSFSFSVGDGQGGWAIVDAVTDYPVTTSRKALAYTGDIVLLDPYLWFEEDIPTVSQMAQYLDNVVNLLGARLVQAQYITLPASMASLTLAGANNIEWALVCVDAVTPVVRKSYIYSGEAFAGEF